MSTPSGVDFEFRELAFDQRLLTFAIVNRDNYHIDIQQFLEEGKGYYVNEIRSILQVRQAVKVNTCTHLVLKKVNIINNSDNSNPTNPSGSNVNDQSGGSNSVSVEVLRDLYIYTANEIIEQNTDLNATYQECVINRVLAKFDEAIVQGSGFSLKKINAIEVQINQYDPMRGSLYIKTPAFLARKKAIINVVNKNDNKCFMWAVLSYLHRELPHSDRVSTFSPFRRELKFKKIKFPVQISDIKKFEEQNNISINLFGFDSRNNKVLVIRQTKNRKANHINLMLLSEEKRNSNGVSIVKQHYCWIKDLSRLISAQLTKTKKKCFFCDSCLNYFSSQNKLNKHLVNCAIQNDCQIEMPNETNNTIFFKNYKNQVVCPFIVYADIETLLKKPNDSFSTRDTTIAFQQHEPYAVGYYLKCSYDDALSHYNSKRGPDCVDWFVKQLEFISYRLAYIFENIIPIIMTAQDEINFESSLSCFICGKLFNRNIDIIVRDHCHFTGKYRGAAHQACNLAYQNYRTIPIVFHNLTNYDSHFLVERIAKGIRGGVKVIPINSEKYISIIKTIPHSSGDYSNMIKLKFIDSFKFVAESLSELASLIPSNQKTLLRKEFSNVCEEYMPLLERKGVFCYDYVDSWNKLDETNLPPKESFKNSLTNEPIKDCEYNFANEIWQKFNIRTIGEYADLYLRVDVCLLAIVFENFRETCLKLYNLDPANYYTAPSLSFDAMLKFTKVKLELPTDVDMLLFVERGIRGGISQCSKRYCAANNKYMGEAFDSNKESRYIMYLDCNNLYGYAMMQHLPTNGFEWIENHQFTTDEILNMPDDGPIGYFF